MQESHGEGLAIRPGPESCGRPSNGPGEALTGERTGRVLSREIKSSLEPTLLSETEGTIGRCDTGKHRPVQARSETPHMYGHLLHGNRETPGVSGVDGPPSGRKRPKAVLPS